MKLYVLSYCAVKSLQHYPSLYCFSDHSENFIAVYVIAHLFPIT